MRFTKHAEHRSQKRSIPRLIIDLLVDFGASEAAGGGNQKLYFDKAARKRVASYAGPLASVLNEHLDVYAVVAGDGKLVTVGHRIERIRRH